MNKASLARAPSMALEEGQYVHGNMHLSSLQNTLATSN